MNTHELLNLAASGYCVVSNKYMRVARIDRKGWKEHMAMKYSPWDFQEGMDWVNSLRNAADHYRRVYSKDTLEFINLEKHMFTCFPKSSDSDTPQDYLELK